MLSSTISGSAAIGFGGLEVETVAGMDLEAERFGARRALPIRSNSIAAIVAWPSTTASHHAPVWISITGAPTSRRGLDLPCVRRDEQRHADAGRLQLGDDRHEMIVLARHVEPAFGGRFLAPLRHDAGGMRARLQRDVDHLARRRHLEIQRLGDLRLQPRDVVVADVAAILAQMRRDAVGAGRDRRAARPSRDRDAARRARCGWSRRDRC